MLQIAASDQGLHWLHEIQCLLLVTCGVSLMQGRIPIGMLYDIFQLEFSPLYHYILQNLFTLMSQNLGRLQPHYNVLEYWDT